jgi:SAM-dependent methyltransferase
MEGGKDIATAQAFSTSWNNLPTGSVYTLEQVLDWFEPLRPEDFLNKSILELGCGNASILVHVAGFGPAKLTGVDLGDSVESSRKNLSRTEAKNWKIERADLTQYRQSPPADVVFCIGVLHHLQDPEAGFRSMLANTAPGGKFHGWVYAWEGNALIRTVVEPIRKFACKLPWPITKYLIATPLAIPTYLGALAARGLHAMVPSLQFPLSDYLVWLAKRDFLFARHVVFDQLVTPSTIYIRKATIESWLDSREIEPGSVYITCRNGNSWRFGGTKLNAPSPSPLT